ncbi:hypothetical protein [Chryseobacterium salivictor]|uniref:Uncharacterized protein n=1 Tax=Chryseobacterium salivictor TaxID=2547600 RepID=A0A4P6ZFS8_9FLAO|nr:hypothetical protein [Chryseobacterium salivictor]QBO58385.1 hypothetical protein NBC122_01570 [Chryseobacterium salivictor]
MKTIKFFKANILQIAGLIAIVLTLSFTFAPGKTENRDKPEKVETVDTVYHYISSDMTSGAFAEPANWSTTDANGECGEPDPIRPCQITVPAGSTLSSVLSGKNNNAVLAISQGYKSNPE